MSKTIKESKTTKSKPEENAKGSKAKDTKAKDTKKKQSGVAKYFKDLKSEFKKVVWPSKKKVFNNTSVVLGSIVLMGIFVGLLDTGLFKLVQLLLSIGTGE